MAGAASDQDIAASMESQDPFPAERPARRGSADRLAAGLGRLSTGLKLLILLGLGLLPLGLVAVLASIDSARENRTKSEVEARAGLVIAVQQLDTALLRSTISLRVAADAIGAAPSADACRRTLARLAETQRAPVRYALFADDGRLVCATSDFTPPVGLPSAGPGGTYVGLSPDGQALRFVLFDAGGDIEGIGEFPRDSLAAMVAPGLRAGNFDMILAGDGREMALQENYRGAPIAREVVLSQPLSAARMSLSIRTSAMPLSAAELLMILLPVLMWVAAAAIGWYTVDRLLLRPLVRVQRAIAAYEPGDRELDLPPLRSPAREIGALGESFRRMAGTVAGHEAELEAAVDRQTRLVREVHHRVKNNLQVVASLLNLHSRSAREPGAAAAYASIQRRVDALSVVHRNHYAELEENRGVALKPLISELGANLRASAPESAQGMQIRLAVEPLHSTQDVAVSVAFLVTEIVEFGMLCGACQVSVALAATGPGTARLAIESDSLAGEIACDAMLFERFDRIIVGLSRQLRSSLERDAEIGLYSVTIAVVD